MHTYQISWPMWAAIVIILAGCAAPRPPAVTPVAAPATAVPAEIKRPANEELMILPPLLVGGPAGRLYALARTGEDGPLQLAVLDGSDGHLLASYPDGGPLALDPGRNRLYVDRGDEGLAVLDATTAETLRMISLPGPHALWPGAPAPQADPAAGQVLAMRGHSVYVLDPEAGKVLRTIDFDLRPEDQCRQPHDVSLPIARSYYDGVRRLLYLDFATYTCTPWVFYTQVSYDMAAGREVARHGSDPYQGLASGGRFYVVAWYRMGIGEIWGERDGQASGSTSGWSSGSGFQLDSQHGRLLQSGDGSIRFFDPDTLRLLGVVPQPVEGNLAGYDPAAGRAYFLKDGAIKAWPAADLEPAAPLAPVAAVPPARPVSLLVPSPVWTASGQDKTIFATWAPAWPETECYVFNQAGGTLLRSLDGGQSWQQPRAGLPAACAKVSALAVSPAYAADHTLLAGLKGNGLFKSTDGGTSWQPSGAGLPHMGIKSIVLSPGFGSDHTAFAAVQASGLLRSTDGGASWQTLDTGNAFLVAMSPEFDRDGTIALQSVQDLRPVFQWSTDRGEHWATGNLPISGDKPAVLLSLAPAFNRWHVMFTLDTTGELYRSVDGGASWQVVLKTEGQEPRSAQILYGPEEDRRSVFLLVTGASDPAGAQGQGGWGRLYRSSNGGQSWSPFDLGANVVPSAIALSPEFAHDSSLLIGTAAGNITLQRMTESN